jgi:hypothetical protein
MDPRAKEEAIEDESRLRCPVLGPSKAGKSSLIDSLDQTFADPLACEGPIQLEYLRGEASVTASISRGPWRSRVRKRLDLLLKEGPAGALFPTGLDRERPSLLDWEREMVEESRHADAIVFCIDSTDPQPDRASRHLHNFLAALGALPQAASRVKTERFLLLLTKIDRLVSRPLDPASPIGEGGRSPAPLQIAAALSPVELACELFHASNLLRILNALKPGAELAIGLVSAWGFDASGFPFIEEDDPVRWSKEGRGRRAADRHPLGVREALCFLIDGQVSGSVELLTREKVTGPRSYVLDLPPGYFDRSCLAEEYCQ